jgi:hypothetical protein
MTPSGVLVPMVREQNAIVLPSDDHWHRDRPQEVWST